MHRHHQRDLRRRAAVHAPRLHRPGLERRRGAPRLDPGCGAEAAGSHPSPAGRTTMTPTTARAFGVVFLWSGSSVSSRPRSRCPASFSSAFSPSTCCITSCTSPSAMGAGRRRHSQPGNRVLPDRRDRVPHAGRGGGLDTDGVGVDPPRGPRHLAPRGTRRCPGSRGLPGPAQPGRDSTVSEEPQGPFAARGVWGHSQRARRSVMPRPGGIGCPMRGR